MHVIRDIPFLNRIHGMTDSAIVLSIAIKLMDANPGAWRTEAVLQASTTLEAKRVPGQQDDSIRRRPAGIS